MRPETHAQFCLDRQGRPQKILPAMQTLLIAYQSQFSL
jgi:hypothetical protein